MPIRTGPGSLPKRLWIPQRIDARSFCLKYDLDPIRDIWTHQQVVGWKECPRWFVKRPLEFEKFKKLVKEIVMPRKLEKWQKRTWPKGSEGIG